MSTSYNRRKKERRAMRSPEEKTIDRKIKAGILPRYSLTDDKGEFKPKVQTKTIGGRAYKYKALDWTQRSTKHMLLGTIKNG